MRVRSIIAVVVWLVTAAAQADVRRISDAERASVEIAAAYLAQGTPAVSAVLAKNSPLRDVPAPLLPSEIEARLGPPAGAKWQLVTVFDALKDKTAAFEISYPSGMSESVFFDLVREANAWRIHDIRIAAMPSTRKPLFEAISRGTTLDASAGHIDTAAFLAGMMAVLLGVSATIMARFRRGSARLLYLAVAVLGAAAAAVAAFKGERLRIAVTSRQSAAASASGPSRLIGLRTALAAGGADVGAAFADIPTTGPAGEIARLWKAEWQLQQMKTTEAKRLLETFPTPSDIPLVETLRARIALVENAPESAILAYQRAINDGPGRDSLWMELSQALLAGGFVEPAKHTLARLVDVGSRDANVYYARALTAENFDESEAELQRAWTMQPVERAHLVAAGLLGSLVRKRDRAFVTLSDPREASFASSELSSRAIQLPAGAVARVSGDFLGVQIGKAELSVPGGAALAPAGTTVVSADEWSLIEEEQALADAPALVASPPSTASLIQPALRQRLLDAARALSSRNRWADVIAITNNAAPEGEFVPTEVFFYRARGLQHLDRVDEARRLLLAVSANPALERKRDALGLERLADMLASFDLWDAAGGAFDRARRIRDNGYANMRLEQIAMDKRLANHYATQKTEHFEIHYPSELPSGTADAIGRVLEGELKRLQAWVPVPNFKPVVVNIVWWRDFRNIYTGSDDILGFYTGKITLPLAGIVDFNPFIVSLITHELCHAMISQATNSQAPHWFQEGLAQRVEMVPYQPNAFNMYTDDKLFAVSVLDSVLDSSRDGDMVGAAYVVSQTLMRFVEAKYGENGVSRLVASYAAGATPKEALEQLSGGSIGDFDAAFRAWGRAENRVFENAVAVRYDIENTNGMEIPRLGVQTITTTAAPEKPRRGSMGGGRFYPIGGKSQ